VSDIQPFATPDRCACERCAERDRCRAQPGGPASQLVAV